MRGMSDSRLRDLERRARQTGALEDYVLWRTEALRSSSGFPLLLRDDCEYEAHVRKYPMCVSSAQRFYRRQDDSLQPLSAGKPRSPSISELLRLQVFLREKQRPVVERSQVVRRDSGPESFGVRAVGVCVGVAYTPRMERIKIVPDTSFLSGNPGSGYRVDFDRVPGKEYRFSDGFFGERYFPDALHHPVVSDLLEGDVFALDAARVDAVESPFPQPYKLANQRNSILHCLNAVILGGVLSLQCASYFDRILAVKKKSLEVKESG